MKLLTKVAKGVAYGDVSNVAVRNVLTEISKSINGKFTEQEMIDTMDYFNWRCPYTGRDLSTLVDCVTDHIYPQNREWCGLNVMGNLVIVDKAANAAKGSKSVDDFLLKSDKIKDIDELGRTRQQRLDKIKAFQNKYSYNPLSIRDVVSPIVQNHYDVVRNNQEDCINDALEELKNNKVNLLTTKVVLNTTTNSPSKKMTTELIFKPSDEKAFVNEFLNKGEARFVLTYDTGAVKESIWKLGNFTANSNLRGNIQSRPFWRNKNKEGLIKVEVIVD